MSLLDYLRDLTFTVEQPGLFWYIGFMIFCYAVYPLVYKIFKENRYKRFGIFMIIYVFILGIIYFKCPVLYNRYEIGATRFPLFVFGHTIAPDVKAGKEYNMLSVIGVVFLCIMFKLSMCIIYGWSGPIFRIYQIIFSIPIMISGLWFIDFLEKHKINYKILDLAGTYSLELLITHLSIKEIILHLGYKIGYFKYYLIVVILSIIASYFYKKLYSKLI